MLDNKLEFSKKRIRMGIDALLNILSSVITIGIIQFILTPYISNNTDSTKFGIIVTLLGINNLTNFLGTSLNNIRLIKGSVYKERNITGDFNLLMVLSVILTFIFMLGYTYYSKISFAEGIMFSIVTAFATFRSYASVHYRITLDFKKNLINSMFLSAGYLIGCISYPLFKSWILPFMLGELFSIGYISFTTNIFKEPFSRTQLWKKTYIAYILLSITALMVALLAYMDRIIILPVLGASFVTIYYISSFAPKMLNVIINPISSIVLSYISNVSKDRIKVYYRIIVLGSFFVAVLSYIIIGLITPLAIKILYPKYYSEAVKYVYLTNLGVSINIAYLIIRPLIIRYCPTWWIVVTQFLSIIVYIGLAIIFMNYWGLYGYCYAAIISNIVLLTLTVFMGYIYIYKMPKNI